MLDRKKSRLEGELHTFLVIYNKIKEKGDKEKLGNVVQEVTRLHRSVYALRKEKIEVCKQFQYLVTSLQNRLF